MYFLYETYIYILHILHISILQRQFLLFGNLLISHIIRWLMIIFSGNKRLKLIEGYFKYLIEITLHIVLALKPQLA